MDKIRRQDTVVVIKGKDRGKKGKILKLYALKGRAIVEGINLIKKHKRKTQQDQKGGIVPIEAPISISNLMYFCKSCNTKSRIGFKILKDGAKARYCKKCNEVA